MDQRPLLVPCEERQPRTRRLLRNAAVRNCGFRRPEQSRLNVLTEHLHRTV